MNPKKQARACLAAISAHRELLRAEYNRPHGQGHRPHVVADLHQDINVNLKLAHVFATLEIARQLARLTEQGETL